MALPVLQHDPQFSVSSVAWVIDAYLITFGGLLLLSGRLGDLLGRKGIFLAGMTLFTISSFLAAWPTASNSLSPPDSFRALAPRPWRPWCSAFWFRCSPIPKSA